MVVAVMGLISKSFSFKRGFWPVHAGLPCALDFWNKCTKNAESRKNFIRILVDSTNLSIFAPAIRDESNLQKTVW